MHRLQLLHMSQRSLDRPRQEIRTEAEMLILGNNPFRKMILPQQRRCLNQSGVLVSKKHLNGKLAPCVCHGFAPKVLLWRPCCSKTIILAEFSTGYNFWSCEARRDKFDPENLTLPTIALGLGLVCTNFCNFLSYDYVLHKTAFQLIASITRLHFAFDPRYMFRLVHICSYYCTVTFLWTHKCSLQWFWLRMENGEWRMENEEWRMENGELRMESWRECNFLTWACYQVYALHHPIGRSWGKWNNHNNETFCQMCILAFIYNNL